MEGDIAKRIVDKGRARSRCRHRFTVRHTFHRNNALAGIVDRNIAIRIFNRCIGGAGHRQFASGVKACDDNNIGARALQHKVSDWCDHSRCSCAIASAFKGCTVGQSGNVDGARAVVVNGQMLLV